MGDPNHSNPFHSSSTPPPYSTNTLHTDSFPLYPWHLHAFYTTNTHIPHPSINLHFHHGYTPPSPNAYTSSPPTYSTPLYSTNTIDSASFPVYPHYISPFYSTNTPLQAPSTNLNLSNGYSPPSHTPYSTPSYSTLPTTSTILPPSPPHNPYLCSDNYSTPYVYQEQHHPSHMAYTKFTAGISSSSVLPTFSSKEYQEDSRAQDEKLQASPLRRVAKYQELGRSLAHLFQIIHEANKHIQEEVVEEESEQQRDNREEKEEDKEEQEEPDLFSLSMIKPPSVYTSQLSHNTLSETFSPKIKISSASTMIGNMPRASNRKDEHCFADKLFLPLTPGDIVLHGIKIFSGEPPPPPKPPDCTLKFTQSPHLDQTRKIYEPSIPFILQESETQFFAPTISETGCLLRFSSLDQAQLFTHKSQPSTSPIILETDLQIKNIEHLSILADPISANQCAECAFLFRFHTSSRTHTAYALIVPAVATNFSSECLTTTPLHAPITANHAALYVPTQNTVQFVALGLLCLFTLRYKPNFHMEQSCFHETEKEHRDESVAIARDFSIFIYLQFHQWDPGTTKNDHATILIFLSFYGAQFQQWDPGQKYYWFRTLRTRFK